MRCLTLADALRVRGAQSIFLSRNHDGHLHQLVIDRGYPLLNLGPADHTFLANNPDPYGKWLGVQPERDANETKSRLVGLDVNWLIVDHYSLDAAWERSLRPICDQIMALDDLANRNHDVEVLLDQNLGKTESDYQTYVPIECKLMLGSQYALLRPEFSELRTKSLARRKHSYLSKVLITMGGIDLDNLTGAVLDALKGWKLSNTLQIEVVMGQNSPWRDHVIEQARHLPFSTRIHVNPQDMANLMEDADLVIGAAGSTSWECCCLGLPALQLILAENQRPIATALSQAGASLLLERQQLELSIRDYMDQFIKSPERLFEMSCLAAGMVDGLGADRVVDYLVGGND